jgi:hypothetical protein
MTIAMSHTDRLVRATAAVEDVSTVLLDADLQGQVAGISWTRSGDTFRLTVHMDTTGGTIRAARALFATNDAPVKDADHPTLLTYEGRCERLAVALQVFGPTDRARQRR